MTREEAIIEAGIEYSIQNSPYCIGGDNFYEKARELNRNKSFEAGVIWADKNPKSPWISVKDDLPCNHEDLVYHNGRCTVEVLVRDRYGNVYTNVMRKGADNIWFFAREQRNIVEFWMPIPELPKEEEIKL